MSKRFYCNLCNFRATKKSDYLRHVNTLKHARNIQNNMKVYTCIECEKQYRDRSGLWRHKKVCSVVEPLNIPDQMICDVIDTSKELQTSVNSLVDSFADLQNIMMNNGELFDTVVNTQRTILDDNT